MKISTKAFEYKHLPGGIRPTVVPILGIPRGLLEFGSHRSLTTIPSQILARALVFCGFCTSFCISIARFGLFQDKNEDSKITSEIDSDNMAKIEVLQRMVYYPYGMQALSTFFNKEDSTLSDTRYKYSGKEYNSLTDMYDFGARYYMPEIGRWLTVDPLAAEMPSWSPYSYGFNNPVFWTDPTGMAPAPPSTHVDQEGDVIAVYDDGDDGVYMHSNGTTKWEINQQRTDNKNTGGTGKRIGEIGGTIDANTIFTNALDQNIEEADNLWNPFTFKNYVKTGGKWDLKSNKNTIYGLANDG